MAVQRFNMNAYSCCWCFFLYSSLLVVTAETIPDPAKALLGKFGTNYSLNAAQTEKLFDSMGISSWDYDGSRSEVKFG